jgi:hypothetical protein
MEALRSVESRDRQMSTVDKKCSATAKDNNQLALHTTNLGRVTGPSPAGIYNLKIFTPSVLNCRTSEPADIVYKDFLLIL